MAKRNLVPNNIANGYPKKCPVCGESCIGVFRTWKPTGRVSCTFLHKSKDKTCKKTYDYEWLDQMPKKIRIP